MDRHFCDPYTDAVSDADRNPKPERKWDCNGDPFGLSWRQSNPLGDAYPFTDRKSYAYHYS